MGLFERLFGKKKGKEEKAVVTEEVKAENVSAAEEPAKMPVKEAPAAPEKEAPAAKEPVVETETEEPKKEEAPKPAPKPKKKPATETAKEAPKETPKEDKNAAAEEAETVAKEAETVEVKGVPTGRFEVKKSKDGRYVFNLFAANRVIVATSQVYSSSTNAVNGIRSVIANAERAPIEDQTLKNYETLGFPKWEIYLDKGNQYRFRLLAPNGSCICHSQGYTNKANCKNGIQSIIRNTKDASIDKAYLKKDKE